MTTWTKYTVKNTKKLKAHILISLIELLNYKKAVRKTQRRRRTCGMFQFKLK